MRKALIFLLCAAELLAFAGKKGLRQNYREVEQLLVIQTMGLDAMRGGVTLSLAAAGEADRGVARLTADGVSISAAMDRIRGYSYEEELFCTHIGQLLLGEKAAEQGVESTLAYISRSPALRLDIPLFVVRGGRAEDAVMNVGSADRGICDVMQMIEQDVRRRGESGLTTAAQVYRDTARCGSALICALEPGPASEKLEETGSEGGGTPLSVAPMGYAVMREGRLCRYLTREQGIAVGFLKNEPGPVTVEVKDPHGSTAVLEVNGGSSRITPVWEKGRLRGFSVQCEARAGILELGGRGALKSGRDEDYLTAQLEAALSRWVSETFQASKELKADFLGLAEIAERSDPRAWRALDHAFVDLLPELELEITVRARLSEMKDMK